MHHSTTSGGTISARAAYAGDFARNALILVKHNWQTRQIEGFVEHSSERATQEVAGKPYLVTRSILYILQPPPILKTISWRAVWPEN